MKKLTGKIALITLGIVLAVAPTSAALAADSQDGSVPTPTTTSNSTSNSSGNDLFDQITNGSQSDSSGSTSSSIPSNNSGSSNQGTSGTSGTSGTKNDDGTTSGGDSDDLLNSIPKGNDDSGFSDVISNMKPVSPGNIAWVQKHMNGLEHFINLFVTAIVIITMFGMILTTALDLFYIYFEPIRSYLDGGESIEPAQSGFGGPSGMGAGNGMYGGGMGGYGMGGGYGGGMGGYGMGGGVSSSATSANLRHHRWVTMTAISAVKEAETSLQLQDNPMGGAYGAVASQQQQVKPRSVGRVYLLGTMQRYIWFALCVVILLGGYAFNLTSIIISVVMGIFHSLGLA